MAHQCFLRAVVLCFCLLPAVHLLADLSTAAADFSRYAEQTSFELSDGRAAERQIAEAFDQRFADQLNPESLAGADDEARAVADSITNCLVIITNQLVVVTN